MKKPDTPANEESRLHTLRSLNILDTAPEERFDRLTRMAKQIFGVPIALVSLIDENRQWFKSCLGLTVKETPRDISFCGHAILGDEAFIIPDTSKDERFADNPLVTSEPFIRFYAGYPLKFIDGSKLGTLCLIDHKPRTLSNDEIKLLEDLALTAESELAAMHLATRDQLTNIINRRGFMMMAQHSLNFCAREGLPASLVFMDLDKFKYINDQFGHAEGDHVLRVFSEHIKTICRDSDLFARLGGDEFVTLFINTSKNEANEIMTRFQRSIDSYNLESKRDYDISFSYGLVDFTPKKHKTIESMLDEGDKLMYKSRYR